MARQIRLTTVDNPWNPFTHEDEWYKFDVSHGYRTWERLAKLALANENLLDDDKEYYYKEAQKTLLELFPSIYTFVVKN